MFKLEGKSITYTTAQKFPLLDTLIGKEIDYSTTGIHNRQYHPFAVNVIKDAVTGETLYMSKKLLEANNK